MAGAKIGALHVSLGLDSAKFNAGLKNAQKGLGGFTKYAIATGAAVTALTGTLAVAMRASINNADALGKSAQKAGVTVEALSRLNYAAKLSDVSLDGLTGGLQKLSKTMADAVGGKGASTVFKALGIDIVDASGKLRDADAVFADIADRFARLPDGATKTALSMQLLGKSGADLIPLLNAGADGLARYAAESDKAGQTISTKTAKAAEDFNDNITRLNETMAGVVNTITAAVLPGLQGMSAGLASLDPQVVAVGGSIAAAVLVAGPLAGGFGAIGKAAVFASGAVSGLTVAVARFATAIGTLPTLATGVLGAYFGMTGPAGEGENALVTDLQKGWQDHQKRMTDIYGGIIGGQSPVLAGGPLESVIGSSGFEGAQAAADAAAAAIRNKAAQEELQASIDAMLAGTGSGTSGAGAALKAINDELAVMNNGLELQKEDWENLQQPIQAAADAVGNVLGNLVDNLLNGQNAVKGLADDFKALGSQLIKMALNQAIMGFLGSLFGVKTVGVGQGLTGAAVYGGGGYYGVSPDYVPSYDGGGFTGPGSRTGGMDGKGGFPAMLHPNETVIDHTKGGGGQSVVRVEHGPGLVGDILKQAANQSVQIVKSQAPAAMASAQRNRVI